MSKIKDYAAEIAESGDGIADFEEIEEILKNEDC